MKQIVAADIGGTHARFAIADLNDEQVVSVGEPVTLSTPDYPRFESAWSEFARLAGPLPSAVAIAIAGPVIGGRVNMTNGTWHLDIAELQATLGISAITALNDFGAVAHAVAQAPPEQLLHVCGPDEPLPERGTVTVIGPGTGLGVAHLRRHESGYHVQATEGGHIGFAPQDELDDQLLARLRKEHGRVVTERLHSGSAIVPIYEVLGGRDLKDERSIWKLGIAREEPIAALAVDRFCASLGTVVGDYALAHGASAVVLAGGIGLKLRDILPASAFGERFRAKPRYEKVMAGIPVKLITHPQPGLQGAAAAFAKEHRCL